MKKSRIFAALLVVALLITALFSGCSGQSTPSPSAVPTPTPTPTPVTLSGTYVIDATPLGMPMQVYLFIKDDNTFQLTNKREAGDNKGQGTVGKNGNTYMLVYSDSKPDAPKTATFTVVGGNLLFSTRVPYGASGLSPNTEDAKNVIYPEAKKLAFETYLGEYAGKSGDYSYSLKLTYGAQYTVTSVKNTDTYTETGSFDIKDTKITLTPQGGTAVEGTIGANQAFSLTNAKLDKSGTKGNVSLSKATTSAYAGTYSAPDGIVLTLDKIGGYTFKSGSYTESGRFSASADSVTFTADSGSKRTGTVANYIAKVSFPKAAGAANADITAYREIIQGNFTASEDIKDGSTAPAGKYTADLTLNQDGTYTFSVKKDGQSSYSEKGKFSTSSGTAGISLDLTSDKKASSTGIISGSGTLNLKIIVDSKLNVVGLKFEKKQ